MTATSSSRNCSSKRIVWDECSSQHRPELRAGQNRGGDIGQQRQGKPAEKVADRRIRRPDLEGEYANAGNYDEERNGKRNDKVHGCRHPAKVGRRFDGVPDHYAHERAVENPGREPRSDRVKQTLSGHLAEFGG